MYSMERTPRKEILNLVETSRVQQTVAIVETVAALEILPNLVERVRKFHYLRHLLEMWQR